MDNHILDVLMFPGRIDPIFAPPTG